MTEIAWKYDISGKSLCDFYAENKHTMSSSEVETFWKQLNECEIAVRKEKYLTAVDRNSGIRWNRVNEQVFDKSPFKGDENDNV